MKRLRYDIIEGFDKGIIDAYENDNNTEIYKISLLKDRFRNIYDLTGKNIKMCLMNPNDKSGTIINIGIEDQVKGLIQLPIKSEITLKDGTYLCQFTITGTNFKQTTKIFTINIKNNLFNDLAGAIEDDERFPILEDALNRLDSLEVELEPMINTLEIKLPELQNALDDIAGYLNFVGEIKNARRSYPDIDTRITNDIDGVNENLEKFNYIPYVGQNIQTKNTFNGYTKEMEIKGLTLQNLHESKTTLENESKTAIYSRTSTKGQMFSKGLYTFKNNSGKIINISIYSKGNNGFVKSIPISTTQILDIQENEFVQDIIGLYSNGWKLEDKELLQKQCVVLKGDYSNKEIPPYFEGIKSVGELEGNKVIPLSNGKNLFDVSQIKEGNGVTLISDGYNINNRWAFNAGKFNINLEPKKNYYAFANMKVIRQSVGATDTNGGKIVLKNPKTNQYLFIVLPKQNGNSFVAPNDIRDYTEVLLYADGGGGSDNGEVEITNIYVAEKTGEYQNKEGFKRDKKEISLPFEGGLKSLPNGVSDEISKRIIYQNVDTDILNGSEDWEEYTKNDNTTIFYYRDDKFKNSPGPGNSISNLFKYDHSFNDIEHFHINQDYGLMVTIFKSKLKTDDVNGFKEWLSQNNIKVYYKLKDTIKYDVDIDINLQSFKDITYISSENAIKPNISCKVLSNIPSVISELNEENAKLRQNESILKDGQITLANTLIGTLEAVALSLDDSKIMRENEQIIALQELILKLQNMR